MKKTLQHIPLFLFLLPVFFVSHGYAENFGFINISDCLLLIVSYAGAAAFIYFLFYLVYRSMTRAALMACYLMAFYFFFGALHDFLIMHSAFLYQYRVMIPVFLLAGLLFAIFLKRTKLFFLKTSLFLNVLFMIYILVDIANSCWKAFHPLPNKLSVYSFVKNNSYTYCKDCPKPDIYFLLFDEYESSSSLRQKYQYDNAGLDSFLTTHGFHIQAKSRGNYELTMLSLSSMLSMSYLEGLNPKQVQAQDFDNAIRLIHDNEVMKFLSYQGYDIVNYSIFDLAGKPSEIEQSILPIRTRLISCRTLFYYLKRDIAPALFTGRFQMDWLTGKLAYKPLHNINKTIELVKKESLARSPVPKFVYAHILMPHYPFFYNASGNLKQQDSVLKEGDDNHIQSYLGYLPYTNYRIKELIATIQKNTNQSAVIIFMGDHGYRYNQLGKAPVNHCDNQNAVFFPDQYYTQFYDSITGVNQFRVVFNSLFKTKLPLLKDSVVFIK